MRECVALIKFGISEERAYTMDQGERIAYLVMFGEMEGGKFNWESMAWVRADA